MNGYDLDDEAWLDKVQARLQPLKTASCSCLTKSPDWRIHKDTCRYRAICEADALISDLREDHRNVRTAARSLTELLGLNIAPSTESHGY